ncbi:uncharacterized protein UHOD_12293 [Ustilago sp. UG-2017b]|nr:uncharacterized protein UHOD_12293 [Ustilago sp. UG-2017b]
MVSSTTDLGRVCNTILSRTYLGEICHRVGSTTDLSELCYKSHDPPDSLISVLPSYELDRSSYLLRIQSHDSVPYYCASSNGQHSSQDAMSTGSKARPTEASNKPLCGQEATPTAMPEVTQLTNHHLKVLSALNDKLRWDKKDLLNPKRVSVHAWQQ